MEKSYAWFRSGANTYASLASGWMSNVYSDFGVNNTALTFSGASTFYSTVSKALASGKPITFGTNSAPPMLVGGHCYTLVGITTDASGNPLYIVRNPWGFNGTWAENSQGLATLTYNDMVANFTQGVMAV